jgi:hypothetical protein
MEMTKQHFSEILAKLFDEKLSEMLLEFCVPQDYEVVDYERVNWLSEIIQYVPRIIKKDKNASSLDQVFKGNDRYNVMRE